MAVLQLTAGQGLMLGHKRIAKVEDSQHARDKYAYEAKTPPHVMVQTTNSSSLGGIMPKLEDIVFTETNASWVHHPHEEALVITIKIANSFIHRLLMDSRSAINILYWDAYQKIDLKQADLRPMTSPLYGFTGKSGTPEGTIKLVVTLGEGPQTVIIVINFLVVNYLLAYNGVLGRPLWRALKGVMSVHCLRMKFPTTVGTGQV